MALARGLQALPLGELIADFTRSQERLVVGLRRMTYADVCRPSGYQTLTVGASLAYIHFHEAQHVGQICTSPRSSAYLPSG